MRPKRNSLSLFPSAKRSEKTFFIIIIIICNVIQYNIDSLKYHTAFCYRKTALLHSGPGSGRILYEPDANDDYDQEDPDDDLDV